MEKPVRFTEDNTILVVVDIQEKLARTMKARGLVVRNTIKLLAAAKECRVPVIVTEQYPAGLGPTVAELQPHIAEYPPIVKTAFSCCGERTFLDGIRASGRTHVLLTGMETHICVLQTSLDLVAAGFTAGLAVDAATSFNPADADVAVVRMTRAGVVPVTTESVIYELLRKAGTPAFKNLLPVLKERETVNA